MISHKQYLWKSASINTSRVSDDDAGFLEDKMVEAVKYEARSAVRVNRENDFLTFSFDMPFGEERRGRIQEKVVEYIKSSHSIPEETTIRWEGTCVETRVSEAIALDDYIQ